MLSYLAAANKKLKLMLMYTINKICETRNTNLLYIIVGSGICPVCLVTDKQYLIIKKGLI